MKHTAITPMKYLLTTLLLILFLLISCGVEESTSPSGTSPGVTTSRYMSFALSNEGRPVGINTKLARASTYQLKIRPTNDGLLKTANYDFAVNPADAITIDDRKTGPDTITFIVNNTAATSVTITATHKEDKDITDTLTLQLAPRADFMSFAINNRSGVQASSAPLVMENDYTVAIEPTSIVQLQTAEYNIKAIPADAITITNTSPNSIAFTVNNTDATSVTITATHKNNPVISNALTLRLDPPAVPMTFTLSSGGTPVSPANSLARAKTYVVTVKRGSTAPLTTANYNITHTPADAITINTTSSNALNFTVNNTAATSVTITATHKDNSAITRTLVLNLAPQADFMSFALNSLGSPVALSARLYPDNVYSLIISRKDAAPLTTANYNITHTPANAIRIDNTRTNSVTFTVNSSGAPSVSITATHKNNSAISKTLVLNLADAPATDFQKDVEEITTVPDLDRTSSATTRVVLSPLGVPAGTPLVKRYATESGAGSKDGTSWANAWAGTNLRNNINAINDASANKVYLIMIAGGIYKPTSGNDRTISFSMKNYVVIMGGFKAGGGWERTGTTVFSGEIGTAANTDNTYNVFRHLDTPLNNSHLYGVTITDGHANAFDRLYYLYAGGMANRSSSPNLSRVVFSNNNGWFGGGMHNSSSASPVVNDSVFIKNTASGQGAGAGVFNASASTSPLFRNTVFIENTVDDHDGAGASYGGGMHIQEGATPVIIGAVFRGNKAQLGGGIFIYEGNVLVANTIFSANSVYAGGSGPTIGGRSGSSIRITGSVFGDSGLANPTNAIVGGGVNISHYQLANGAVNFGADATTGGLTYPTIQGGSIAIDHGIHVRRSGTTYYFSQDTASWYTDFRNNTFVIPAALPANAEDLTITDITGKARTGRPDAGVFELP